MIAQRDCPRMGTVPIAVQAKRRERTVPMRGQFPVYAVNYVNFSNQIRR
jgi:hypothetical protein